VTARYRRKRPSRGDSLAAAAVSVALGAGVAAAAFYFTRLLLCREPLAGSGRVGGDESLRGRLNAGVEESDGARAE
jgi:hypothetical protein